MDPSLGFAQLLGIAQGNQTDKTTSSKHLLKAKISGNKKEKREKGKASPNVQKFLEKKAAEERRKRVEEKLRLAKLTESRSLTEKNKINKHLKVTKSANYSVLSDALDNRDTAYTLQDAARRQCDEDDYGFASKTSQGIYEKLMNKYEADPEDPMAKFSRAKPKAMKDLSSAKERVREALKREEDNAMVPGKRRSKVNESEKEQPGCRGRTGTGVAEADKRGGGGTSSGARGEAERKRDEEKKVKSERERKEEEARRKRIANAKKRPPTLDFQSLLLIAKEKKDIPVKVEKKKSTKESEFGSRPMTEQEKKEFVRENDARLRREGKLPREKAPERRREVTPPDIDLRDSRKAPEPGPQFHPAAKRAMPEREERQKGLSEYEKEKKEMEKKMRELEQRRAEMDNKYKIQQMKMTNEKKKVDFEKKKDEEKRKELERRRDALRKKEEERELGDMQTKYKEMQRKMKEMESRLKGGGRGSGSGGARRDVASVEARSFPGEKRARGGRDDREEGGAYKRRIESDSEEEYDSELDDFIDDTDAKVDVSKEIRSIFGYDKRKYRDEDFDDRSMENNKFSSIMMEEARSSRIGRQEDLEDMRREAEEEKRKRMRR